MSFRMKKKVFYQTKIGWQLLCFSLLAVVVLGVVVGVSFIGNFIQEVKANRVDIIDWVDPVIYCIALLAFLQCFIKLERLNVILDTEKVYMKEEWSHVNSRTQFYSEVKFVDIESIDIIWTNKNSRGKPMRSLMPVSSIGKSYLAIKDKQGKNNNFVIINIRKKDVLKLIDEIQARMKAVGNDKKLINKEEVLKKLTRKKVFMDV